MSGRLRGGWATVALTGLVLSTAATSSAAPAIAAPGDPSFDATLSQLADGYQLQQDTFAALQFGLSLDVNFNPTVVPTVQAFFAQSATTDFATFAAMQPFAAVESYDEYADLGNFAGIASVGVAARLLALEAQGAPTDQITAARAAAVRAAQAWHVYGAIGGGGVIARGIQRTTPLDPTTGPLPGTLPTLVPLADAMGNPLPNPKAGVWRAPVASGFDGWIWLDDTSKDQVSGYALAAAWLWDALAFDPMVDPTIPAALAADLAALAKALMQPSPEYDDIDLCLRDADGRLTDAHDLNPRQIVPTGVLPATATIQNGFNATMALGVIRAAYHVGGDPVVGKYYYDELVAHRGFPKLMSDAGLIFTGSDTNYSNVNMLAISFALLARFETDPALRASFAASVETTFWNTGSNDDVSHVKQAWFDEVYGAMSAHPTATIRQRVAGDLGAFPSPPAFYVDRVNCSPSAIDAGVCIGVDGTTSIALSPQQGHDGTVVAADIVPMAIRPYSDFQWRADPHAVNGTGSPSLMEPGGDYLAAYWFGRVVDLDDPSKNITSHPRAPYVDPDGGVDAGGKDGGATDARVTTGDAARDAVSRDAVSRDAVSRDAPPAGDAGARASPSAASCGCYVPGGVDPSPATAITFASWVAALAVRRRARAQGQRL